MFQKDLQKLQCPCVFYNLFDIRSDDIWNDSEHK